MTGGALRYRLLETIRQFAAERLAEAGEDEAAAVAAAHGRHYLSVAEAAAPHLRGSDQGNWFARLDADQANLWRAARYASSVPGGTEQVLRLAVGLDRYWMARSRGEEALAPLTPALERPDARADPVLFARALVDPVRSGELFDEAIACTQRSGDQLLAYIMHNNAGVHALRVGDIPAATRSQKARTTGSAACPRTAIVAKALRRSVRTSVRNSPSGTTPGAWR